MQGPSVSSAYHTADKAYPTLYDGLVCLPGAASNFAAVDYNYGEPTQAVGFAFWSSARFILPDGATITCIS